MLRAQRVPDIILVTSGVCASSRINNDATGIVSRAQHVPGIASVTSGVVVSSGLTNNTDNSVPGIVLVTSGVARLRLEQVFRCVCIGIVVEL